MDLGEWGDEEGLTRVGGRKTIIRIHYMKKISIFN